MKIIERKIAEIFLRTGQTLCLAESCTGGLVANRITNISGSSQFFIAGVVTYSNASKHSLLQVPKTLLTTFGAVSEPVAQQMAKGARKRFQTDFAVAITGIAGPGGGSETKPVGLTFISFASAQTSITKEFHFSGTRLSIKRQAAEKALRILFKHVA